MFGISARSFLERRELTVEVVDEMNIPEILDQRFLAWRNRQLMRRKGLRLMWFKVMCPEGALPSNNYHVPTAPTYWNWTLAVTVPRKYRMGGT